ncbi:Nitrilotriacetate monooxygenase component B [Patulibacter medicamentivorans]|uniref:Nitrilotriacetate monooxygenase component B n=1 Tax=Patulibacter medicamentivorans TaxID=1097667 RepID=H0E816_9ACTN|nr:flavin reductase family protein [Patulibacter medicamentivorans]EHN10214.1 Nitrilotriacetate monooxygenase component B [Patulibacter medicamentivorans]
MSVTTISPEAMRATLGRFCTGVTVVTTADDAGDDVHAMTANGFASVSLTPPLVLVSVDHRTRMHQRLPETGRYGVSILAADQERIALHFAGRPLAEHDELFEWADGVPFVRGAIAHVGCRLHACHEAGDHTLYLGRVGHLASRAGDPLLFHRGSFGQMSRDEALASGWVW